jgi:hypothetical protein
VRRMTCLLTAAVAVTLLGSTTASAQTPPASPDKAPTDRQTTRTRTPQQELSEAKRLLDGINEASLDGEASRRLATLKNDMNELAATYLGQKGATPPTGTAERAAATSGNTGTSIPGSVNAGKTADWKTKYTAVENDLRELLGSGSNLPSGSTTAGPAPVSGGIPNLNAAVRGQLQDVRTHLELFYTQTVGQPDRPGAVK